jgi:hypothetical protein
MLAACLFAQATDLESVRAESNLEKRSDRALENANHAIDMARDSYAAGELKKSSEALQEVRDSVALSYESLSDSGKNPRRSPKHFKRAEMSIREMLRRLKGLESDFSVEDRNILMETERQLQQIRDDLLAGIMSKKK